MLPMNIFKIKFHSLLSQATVSINISNFLICFFSFDVLSYTRIFIYFSKICILYCLVLLNDIRF